MSSLPREKEHQKTNGKLISLKIGEKIRYETNYYGAYNANCKNIYDFLTFIFFHFSLTPLSNPDLSNSITIYTKIVKCFLERTDNPRSGMIG